MKININTHGCFPSEKRNLLHIAAVVMNNDRLDDFAWLENSDDDLVVEIDRPTAQEISEIDPPNSISTLVGIVRVPRENYAEPWFRTLDWNGRDVTYFPIVMIK